MMETFDKVDKWAIVDISEEFIPSEFMNLIEGYATYKDITHMGEDLYSMDHILSEIDFDIFTTEEIEFINRVKEIMAENDAFYFRILSNV